MRNFMRFWYVLRPKLSLGRLQTPHTGSVAWGATSSGHEHECLCRHAVAAVEGAHEHARQHVPGQLSEAAALAAEEAVRAWKVAVALVEQQARAAEALWST